MTTSNEIPATSEVFFTDEELAELYALDAAAPKSPRSRYHFKSAAERRQYYRYFAIFNFFLAQNYPFFKHPLKKLGKYCRMIAAAIRSPFCVRP